LDRIERTRLHALWLLSQGQTSAEITQALGYRFSWLYRIVPLYNTQGPEAMRDGRHHNRGHPPLLNAEQLATLDHLLERPAPDGTPWSGPKVAEWMSEQLGRRIRPQRGWDYLRRTDHTPQRPRPRHRDADAAAQARFPRGAASGA
jgi:transposase